ncbi:Glutathione-regulated potassium-efflux system ancillary protein KefG [Apilactobacillus kunkeei]|uniref:NAD(P)H-dependent oxidoreductase n=1 Tax=Apilactobacillus kunkeei TaxID=148814 RepID=UPI00220E3404|nr:NAD(P)H-dependent oxidoreductase [Apilactobacillus kunkeei]UZX32971.1 NAD(P)H-dependent oxidoreductase [Apilactobacillus kunkeei]CAI2645375.1 Glutathione-regulated potassium-efflux system ancillary protein KefG [Apilactobacillus kunkeei]CAI2646213.1 Glutathione-regulated potassium-efflux system ancillary protein KefG [Apilactobacillus kunkeei]CAI2647225.1 Glutathione-regulated potassium-efflux system ancillary protein KefG [Apilactobacillus kunkeei]CAI2649975.1 Glutathione-regulated potassi
MKTLVLVSHPEYDNSMTEAFLKQCQSDIENVDWVVLDNIQTEFTFDKEQEQQRLTQYDRILFQFPMYWYSAPALMKKYEDDVFTKNFIAYEQEGKLKGKEIGIITTLGDPIKDYQVGGREGFSISELLKPYQAIAQRGQMKFLKPFVISQFAYMTDAQKQKLLIDYRSYLTSDNFDSFTSLQKWYIDQLTVLKESLDEDKQARMDILIDYLQSNYDQLDELKWEIDLIKKEDDE